MSLELIAGRYRLYEPIASGGMGTVHFARLMGDVGFARTVAIKRVHPKYLKSGAIVAGLVDEARLASRIQHPNVIPTLDVFVHDGELFVVMEFVLGETLAHLNRDQIQRGEPMPIPVALSVGIGMLQGLHAAHEAKSENGKPLRIVHRDVSPQNVLVGVDGMARVLDFGIAKASDRLSSTIHGEIKGKPRYMAPEQISGGHVTRRTDVLAAGIVLWEALAGRRLYTSDSEVALAYADRRPPAPVSKFNPRVTARLDAVLRRAMAFDPIDRFEDAASFAVALEETGEVATSRRVGEWVRETAARSLTERAQRIGAIEGGSSRLTPTVSADEVTGSQVEVGGAARVSPTAWNDQDATDRDVAMAADQPTRSDAITVKATYAEETRAFDAGPIDARRTKVSETETTKTASTLVAAPESSRSRWRSLGLLLAFASFVGLAGALLFRRAWPPELVSPPSATPKSGALVVAAPSPSLAATSTRPEEVSTVRPFPAPSTTASTPSAIAQNPKVAQRNATAAVTAAPATGATPPQCVPPFSWVDGVKKYKPECLAYMK